MLIQLYDKIKIYIQNREKSSEAILDNEFLPASLEILETPPSPNHVAFMQLICVFVTVSLVWSYLGHIDIVAVAQGKVQPKGRVKIIQPVDGGKIVSIDVENGEHVKSGQVLVELDPSETRADASASLTSLLAFKAEVIRRRFALKSVETDYVKSIFDIPWPNDIPNSIKSREERALAGDLSQLSASLSSINAQIIQKNAEKTKLEQTISAQEQLISVLKQRVQMRSLLYERRAGTRTSLIDAQESLSYHITNLSTQKGSLQEAKANLEVLNQERQKFIKTFIADNSSKLVDAERQVDDFEQKLVKANVKEGHTRIVSPIDGAVFGSVVTTPGQVVSPGEEIMRIVPDNAVLEIEGYLENKDIGFVKVGQEAIIKVEAFPFTRYGVIDAMVTKVSHDAIPQPDVQTQEGNPSQPIKSTSAFGAQRMQNLMFPVNLKSENLYINVNGEKIALVPGMAVTIEIKTGKRRILEYIFSPLVETSSRALKER